MPTPTNQLGLTVGRCATLACVLEATAPKPGNVHRGADFEDLTYTDLVLSGVMIGPEMELASERPLGETILSAVQATRRVVATNSNLGMILLLAPLAAACGGESPDGAEANTSPAATDSVRRVLDGLSRDDARLVYEAIWLAKPGGMGKVETADVADEPPESLLEAMRLAADRDLVAWQYAGGFVEVFEDVVPALREALSRFFSIPGNRVRLFAGTCYASRQPHRSKVRHRHRQTRIGPCIPDSWFYETRPQRLARATCRLRLLAPLRRAPSQPPARPPT